MKLSIVIPVLNEVSIIDDCLDRVLEMEEFIQNHQLKCDIVLSDAGSTDGSLERGRVCCENQNWTFVENAFKEPSVGKTVKSGIEKSTGDYIFILPCDCYLENSSLLSLIRLIQSHSFEFAGFQKSYNPSSILMNGYSKVQNLIRTRGLKHMVWTNGMIISRKVLDKVIIPTQGFLEDVSLSDQMRRVGKVYILKSSIQVSSRRYNKKFKRILINFSILFLFRVGFRNIPQLKKFYLLLS